MPQAGFARLRELKAGSSRYSLRSKRAREGAARSGLQDYGTSPAGPPPTKRRNGRLPRFCRPRSLVPWYPRNGCGEDLTGIGDTMDKILKPVEKVLNFSVAALIGLMMVWVFVQVITRYLFGFTPSFGEELARYMFVWIVFLSLPVVAKKGGHMAIEMITLRLEGPALKFCRVAGDSFTMAFLILMVYQGVLMVERASFQTSPALEISMSWVYIVIPVGCFIMLLNVLGDFYTLLRTPAAHMKKGA